MFALYSLSSNKTHFPALCWVCTLIFQQVTTVCRLLSSSNVLSKGCNAVIFVTKTRARVQKVLFSSKVTCRPLLGNIKKSLNEPNDAFILETLARLRCSASSAETQGTTFQWKTQRVVCVAAADTWRNSWIEHYSNVTQPRDARVKRQSSTHNGCDFDEPPLFTLWNIPVVILWNRVSLKRDAKHIEWLVRFFLLNGANFGN